MLYLRWTPYPVIVTSRDNGDDITVLLSSYLYREQKPLVGMLQGRKKFLKILILTLNARGNYMWLDGV